jgi:hypothetical protein
MEKAIRKSSPRWYDRVWVAQEYILATNAYFCYGSRRIKDLGVSRPIGLGFGFSETRFKHFWAFNDRVWAVWGRWKPRENEHRSLQSHEIVTVAPCSVKDSRDRVYGVLGFIHPDENALVPVDYSLPSGAGLLDSHCGILGSATEPRNS